LRKHPHLYELDTLPWLRALSRELGRPVTLGDVPDDRWDALRELGIDLVYLMGIWRRSAISRQIARAEPALFDAYERALPGWRAKDVAGSAFSVAAYEPDEAVGAWGDVDAVREKLHRRGMQLIVDFVVNHTAFDHPWVAAYPDRYVNVPEDLFRRDRGAARIVETGSGDVRFIACGRDPYFPPWEDVAQVNHFSADAREALIGELRTIAQHADGARCDMAMLALSDVFERTWASLVRMPRPPDEFWAEARAAVPGFTLVAEVYWDLEWRLQQLGFDFTYDKKFYDRLLHGSARDVRDHLRADAEYQRRSVRFIENHDEERSAAAFGDRVRAAAVAVSTVQGMRFYQDGQLAGWRVHVPVQLGAAAEEPVDGGLMAFYRRLLAIVNQDAFHEGDWQPLDVDGAGDDSHEHLAAWRWASAAGLYVVVVNLGNGSSQGHVRLNSVLPLGPPAFVFEDVLNERAYPWSRSALEEAGGLYVSLGTGEAHILRVA
jgi:alpha amylase-like protein